MRRLLGIAAGAAALAFAAGGAQATELVFTITGAGNIITFDLPQHPTPDSYTLGQSFTFTSVDGTFDGTPTVFDGATFWNPDQDTGDLHLDSFSPYFGDILYTGMESSPTFKTGSFDIGDGEFSYTLTISAVPEPSTWGLMLLGFAGLGFAGYRRSVKAAAAA
ncbi:MAG: PEP-CTERM sorting domain-containing protein [Roseiarcus sp.]